MNRTVLIEPDARSRTVLVVLWPLAFVASLGLFLASAQPGATVLFSTLAAGALLLLIALHDERTFLIPDALVILLCALALAFHAGTVAGKPWNALAGGMLGLAILWIADFAYRLLRGRRGLGMGDLKLLGAAGLLVGSEGVIGVLLWALLTALALCAALFVAGRIGVTGSARIPFGSHLAFGTWMVWLWGPPILFVQ